MRTSTRYRDLYDDRYGFPGLFSLETCESCGHSHVPAQFNAAELGRLYTEFYPRAEFTIEAFHAEPELHGFRSWMNGDRASAFRWVPRNVRVLDIGCGTGQALAYHRNRGCQATGVEADANVIPIAKHFGLDVRLGLFDPMTFEPASFDWVTLDQVAEHVVDPKALMQGIARVLRPGGTAVVTTPNPEGLGARVFGRRWLNWHIPYHLQFYTRRSFRIIAETAGLRVQSVRTVTASEWAYLQWAHVHAFPEAGQKSAFWAPPKGGPRKTRRLALLAHEFGLHQVVSRTVDALSLGDCRIFHVTKPLPS